MPQKEETKKRKMIVVEEVKTDESSSVETKKTDVIPESQILEKAAKDVVSIEPEPETNNLTPGPKKSSSIVLWIIIPGIFLLGAILGGIVFYQRGVNSEQEQTPTPAPTTVSLSSALPSASPTASSDLTKYTISIFNGSGIAGEAGKAKSLLTTAGFKVGSTANAASYNYTKTIIKAKSSVDASFVSALSTALGKTYVVDAPLTLATSSADTVQVVIGSTKAQ